MPARRRVKTRNYAEEDRIKPVKLFEERVCQHCGKVFVPTNAKQIYCDTECRLAYHAKKQGDAIKLLRAAKKKGLVKVFTFDTTEGKREIVSELVKLYGISRGEAADEIVYRNRDETEDEFFARMKQVYSKTVASNP